MSEWTKQRRCEKCGAAFTLEQHGHEGAKLAAESLQRATGPAEGADYFAVKYCPTHQKEAVEAALSNAFAGAGGGRSISDVTPKQAALGWIIVAALVAGGVLAWKFLF